MIQCLFLQTEHPVVMLLLKLVQQQVVEKMNILGLEVVMVL
jgi:hypothetical protein